MTEEEAITIHAIQAETETNALHPTLTPRHAKQDSLLPTHNKLNTKHTESDPTDNVLMQDEHTANVHAGDTDNIISDKSHSKVTHLEVEHPPMRGAELPSIIITENHSTSPKKTAVSPPTGRLSLLLEKSPVAPLSPERPPSAMATTTTSPPPTPMGHSHNTRRNPLLKQQQQQQQASPLSSTSPPKTLQKNSTTNNNSKDKESRTTRRTKKKGPSQRLWQDAVVVHIPMHITGDWGTVLTRVRARRRMQLLQAFPELAVTAPKETNSVDQASTHETTQHMGELITEGDELETKAPQRSIPKHIPQREAYSSFVDYLEAKYSQGVMLDQEEDEDGSTTAAAAVEPEEEGQGSVYSQDSFFDDTDLRRTVAEQVLARSTTTKLELQDQDNDFFVNVGNLEVEETEMTADGYDPLTDVNAPRKRGRKKKEATEVEAPILDTGKKMKRKEKVEPIQSTSPTASLNTSSGTNKIQTKKRKVIDKDKEEKASTNTKPTTAAAAAAAAPKPKKKKVSESPEVIQLRETAAEARKQVDHHLAALKAFITSATPEELPRRRTKDKVTLTCLPEKKPGDTITFSNPHVPGQRLRVKIPPNTMPGGTFKVTVPVVEEIDEDIDYNKWRRPFYEDLDNFARVFDNWCEAVGTLKTALGDKEYNAHSEKRTKFEVLLPLFPKNLKTHVDRAYLQKILRRARQNRHKRLLTAQRQGPSPDKAASSVATTSSPSSLHPHRPSLSTSVADSTAVAPQPPASTSIRIRCPHLSTEFRTIAFDLDDFNSSNAK
jgi:hypothetical protein